MEAESNRLDYVAHRAERREAAPVAAIAQEGEVDANQDANTDSAVAADISADVDTMYNEFRADERAFLVAVGLKAPSLEGETDVQ